MLPAQRERLMWRLAELIDKNADELAELESVDNGKTKFMASIIDVPWRAATTSLHGGLGHQDQRRDDPQLHRWHPRREVRDLHVARAGRGVRADRAVEFSARDGGVEARPGARGRLHLRAQTRRADAAHGAATRRARHGSRVSAGCRQHHHRAAARPAGAALVRASGYRQGRVHRFDRGRQDHQQVRDRYAQARVAGAGRQIAGPGVSRCRRERRHRGRFERHLLQPRPGVLRGLAPVSRIARCSTRWSRASVARKRRSSSARASTRETQMGPLVSRSSRTECSATSNRGKSRGRLSRGWRRVRRRAPATYVEPDRTRQREAGHARGARGDLRAGAGAQRFDDVERDRARRPTIRSYGLAASVWSKDVEYGARASRAKIKAGTVWVNCHNFRRSEHAVRRVQASQASAASTAGTVSRCTPRSSRFAWRCEGGRTSRLLWLALAGDSIASPHVRRPPISRTSEAAANRKPAAPVDGECASKRPTARLGNWMSHGRTYDEQRFSPAEANRRAQRARPRARLAFRRRPADRRGQESTPLVIDGVMYVHERVEQGVCARRAHRQRSCWEYDPQVPADVGA